MFKQFFAQPAPLPVFMRWALILTFCLLPAMGWADNPSQGNYGSGSEASSLGDVFCNLFFNAKPFGYIFQWAAYILGTICAVQGIMQLRLWTEKSDGTMLKTGIMLLLGSSALLALPSIVDTIITTLYGTPGAGGALTCSASSGGGSASTIDVMLTNMVNNIKTPLIALCSIVAIVCGLFMMINGLRKASRYGFDPKENGLNKILINIVFGALLFTIGDNLKMVTSSVFGTSSISGSSAISWTIFTSLAGGASSQFQTAVIAALTFVQIIGTIAFVRGWLMLKKSVEGGGNPPMLQALTHILGGVAAINIFAFLKLMDNTFGTGFL